jgi:hypothetical protein
MCPNYILLLLISSFLNQWMTTIKTKKIHRKKSPLQLKEHNDEDILGPCCVRFNLEAHIPPVEYG